MNKLEGEDAIKFVAWLHVAKNYLPRSMSINEASQIFLRRLEEDKGAKDGQKVCDTQRTT